MSDTKETKIRIASSNNDICMKQLAYLLETQYPDITFDLYIGHTTILYSLVDDPKLDGIIRYCEGYCDGWDAATE
jgi:hypothetical protein